jgi:hypothetical protein
MHLCERVGRLGEARARLLRPHRLHGELPADDEQIAAGRTGLVEHLLRHAMRAVHSVQGVDRLFQRRGAENDRDRVGGALLVQIAELPPEVPLRQSHRPARRLQPPADGCLRPRQRPGAALDLREVRARLRQATLDPVELDDGGSGFCGEGRLALPQLPDARTLRSDGRRDAEHEQESGEHGENGNHVPLCHQEPTDRTTPQVPENGRLLAEMTHFDRCWRLPLSAGLGRVLPS